MVPVNSTKTGQKFVLYFRVSSKKQGIDGNGIAAQERDINIFLGSQDLPEVIGRFYEVESGAVDARPELMKALDLVRETGAHLCFQKVDRLSRDVEFIARLVKDPKVHLRVANLPNADSFQIHLFAALGFAEREFISQRTRVAMAAAKAKGKRFGNPRIGELNKARKNKARQYSSPIAPIVLPLRAKGMTYQQIATTLNEMKIKTPQGGSYFYPTQVKRIIDRHSK